jgi:hypothetical protein
MVFCFSPMASDALAQPDGSCRFDVATQSVEFSISGGQAVDYDVKIRPTGCIQLFNEDDSVVTVQGPEVSGSVKLECIWDDSTGHVEVEFCQGGGGACFDECEFEVECTRGDGICSISVPSVSEWGLLILLLLLLASGAYVVRRRRAMATR